MLLKAALNMEAAAMLALAWVLVFVMPHGWARRLFVSATDHPARNLAVPRPSDAARAAAVTGRVNRLSAVMPFRTTCLVRATAGALLLRRRGLRDVTIRFGVRKTGGALEAHAWLIHQGVVLLGGQDLDSYTPLADLPIGHHAAVDKARVPRGTRT